MYVISAALEQCNFCYLLRFIIVSSVHGAFSLSNNAQAQNTGTQKFLLESLKEVLILEVRKS